GLRLFVGSVLAHCCPIARERLAVFRRARGVTTAFRPKHYSDSQAASGSARASLRLLGAALAVRALREFLLALLDRRLQVEDGGGRSRRGRRPGRARQREGLPELSAVGAVVGREEEGAADVGEVGGIAVARAGPDVLDQARARAAAVGLPELAAVGALVGGEEQGAAEVGQVLRRAAARGVDVLDQRRARVAAVGA